MVYELSLVTILFYGFVIFSIGAFIGYIITATLIADLGADISEDDIDLILEGIEEINDKLDDKKRN